MIAMNRQAINPCFLCTIFLCLALYLPAIAFFFHSCLPSSLRQSKLHSPPPSCNNPSQVNLSSTANVNTVKPQPLLLRGPASHVPLPLLKIFMYDLPRKFTYGVIEAYLKSRSMAKKGPIADDSQLVYPGNQHSAEWWLFSDLLRPQEERSSSISVRVARAEDADIFFAPFFSSLSLIVNPPGLNSNISRTNYSDEAMQTEFVEWLEGQDTWQRNRGRDHIIVCQDPNALHLVISRLKHSILLVSDFGRLEPDEGSWWKDVVLPYSHRIASYVRENSTLVRNTLLFFMGNRYRKEGGKIRGELFNVLENEEGVILKHGLQSMEGRRWAAQGMRTSKFCLHPAGDTPSACRLFDAIVSLCVPVVVSDEVELPFEDELDYTKFALFVPSYKALEPGYLATLLREVSSTKLQQYQQELRKVRKYFEYGEPDGAVDQIWRVVSTKLQQVRTMINRDRRAVDKEYKVL